MNLQSFVVLLIVFVLLALAIVWIAKNGGWNQVGCHGCGGNCASCHEHCATEKHPAKSQK